MPGKFHRTSRILKGWSEIAEYARCSQTQVRTWARERGLPVVVLRRGRHPAALISTAVFDAWLALQSPAFKREQPAVRRRVYQLSLRLTSGQRRRQAKG